MNERSVGRLRHISVTRTTSDGMVSHTEVRISEVSVVGDADDAGMGDAVAGAGERFDPSTCCSRREQAMIAALREYLRPQEAPECLRERIRVCLDRCCDGR